MLLALILTATLAQAADNPLAVAKADAARPNIILITADDLGFQLGCYGDTVATTPHMDRLARGGIRFTRGFVTQSSCSSSRSSLLTGLYPHQNGQIGLAGHDNDPGVLTNGYAMRPNQVTLPTLLKQAGYRTGIIGKLHVQPASTFDFDYKELSTDDTRDMEKLRANCNAFLGDTGGKPFFFYVNLYDPHAPWTRDVHGRPKTKVTAEQVKLFPFMGANDDSAGMRQQIADYYTCVNRVDEGMGVLLDVLRERGLIANTLVVLLGDNGPPFSRAKVSSFEAGVNTPFIISWPGRVMPRVSDEFICGVDFLPTFLELAGVKPPGGLAGRSLVPLLSGEPVKWREWLATEYTTHETHRLNPQRSLRDTRYKLTLTLLNDPAFKWPESITLEQYRKVQPLAAKGDFIQLYDLKGDPYEFKNLAGKPELREVQDRLSKQLHSWRAETQDPLLDLAALQALVLQEKDRPPAKVPAWKRAMRAKYKTGGKADEGKEKPAPSND